MKQFKISFYPNRKTCKPAIYYREFENVKELKDWANHWLNDNSIYFLYSYIKITKQQYLGNYWR